LIQNGKNNDCRHVGNAHPFQVNTENIALQITARRVAVIIIRHDADTGQRQHNGDEISVFFDKIFHVPINKITNKISYISSFRKFLPKIQGFISQTVQDRYTLQWTDNSINGDA